MLLPWSRRAKCWFFGVSVVRIWPKKVGLDEPMTFILAKTSKRCQSTKILSNQNLFLINLSMMLPSKLVQSRDALVVFFIYNRFGLSRSQEGYCSRYFFYHRSTWEKRCCETMGLRQMENTLLVPGDTLLHFPPLKNILLSNERDIFQIQDKCCLLT